MKKAFFAIAMCISMGIHAQNVGIGNSSPNVNAKLDITATDKGLLIPRMDSTHRKAIPNTIGLLVYDSTTNSFWYNNGTAWQNIFTSSSGWSLNGNSNIDPNTNFLGTTDNSSLIFKTNGTFAGILGDGLSLGLNSFNGSAPGVVAIGPYALRVNKNMGTGIGGYDNTAVGVSTLANSVSGYNNVAVGSYTLNQCTTCQGTTATGAYALTHFTEGNNNTAYGSAAMAAFRTGSDNVAIGAGALTGANTGDQNTAIGARAFIIGGGSHNTALGYSALGKVLIGSDNTAIGYNADLPTFSTTITNATVIGANAKVNASNKIRLGDENVTVVESNGVFNTVSDGRFKYNVQENVKGLDFVLKLRPVTYQFDTKKQEAFTKGNLSAEDLNSTSIPVAFTESNSIKRTGFIAQEVAAAANKSGYDFDGVKIPANDKQYYSLSYASFVVPLVKAVQEQQQTIDELKKQNELLLKRIEALEKK